MGSGVRGGQAGGNVKVRWTVSALRDRHQIVAFIRSDNPRAAERMDRVFSAAAARLVRHPRLGRPGLIAGTRELIPHRSYRLVYEIDNGTIWVLVLVHSARQWPPVSGDAE